MAKGFLAGVIVGGVVSVLGVAVVSPLLRPVKSAPTPDLVVETLSDTTESAVDTPLVDENTDVTEPAPAADLTDEAVVSAPEIAPADDAVQSEPETAPTDDAVQSAPETAPADEALLSEPEAAPADEAVVSEVEAAPADEVVVRDAEAAPADEAVVSEAEVTPADETVVSEAEVAPADETVISEAEVVPADEAPEAETVLADASDAVQPAPAPTTDDGAMERAVPAAPEHEAPEIAMQPDITMDADAPEVSQSEQAGFGTAVAPIDDRATGVTTDRLPSIGGTSADPDAVAQEAPEAGTLPDAAPELPSSGLSESPLAIERNAVPYTDTDGRPLMALVLKDMGAARSELKGIDKLPFAISVVVDVNAADLDDAIAFYRAAGAEIIVQADLPAGSTPTDAEVNFQVQQPNLNKGVAVFMAPETGFQTNAPLSRQISEILVTSGHGLVTRPEGLNTGHKNALKIGVPSALVFRDLDADGQDSKVIRRFLDNAAFKAGQEEGVILMGRAVPETMAALIEWNLGNRANSVALVPVSTVLLGGS